MPSLPSHSEPSAASHNANANMPAMRSKPLATPPVLQGCQEHLGVGGALESHTRREQLRAYSSIVEDLAVEYHDEAPDSDHMGCAPPSLKSMTERRR